MVQWLRLRVQNAGGLGSIAHQGTRSHMPQLKIPHAVTKAWHSQINKYIFLKNPPALPLTWVISEEHVLYHFLEFPC